jgi:hypothetical protein
MADAGACCVRATGIGDARVKVEGFLQPIFLLLCGPQRSHEV